MANRLKSPPSGGGGGAAKTASKNGSLHQRSSTSTPSSTSKRINGGSSRQRCVRTALMAVAASALALSLAYQLSISGNVSSSVVGSLSGAFDNYLVVEDPSGLHYVGGGGGGDGSSGDDKNKKEGDSGRERRENQPQQKQQQMRNTEAAALVRKPPPPPPAAKDAAPPPPPKEEAALSPPPPPAAGADGSIENGSSDNRGGSKNKNDSDSDHNSLLRLNDRTIKLNPDVSRPWVEARAKAKASGGSDNLANPPVAPAKVLLTSYGWNHVDQAGRGLKLPRSARQRQLLQGVVDHPYFDPSGWEEIMEEKLNGTDSGAAASDSGIIDPSIRYYVFLDMETCFEGNFPIYAGFGVNADREGNRTVAEKRSVPCYNIGRCSQITKILDSPLFTNPNVNATLVLFDCKGDGPPASFRRGGKNDNGRFGSKSISVASVSSSEGILNLEYDQGLPPPAVSPVALSPEQERAIEECDESDRPYLLTFSGAGRGEGSRQAIVDLNNDEDIFTVRRRQFKGNMELTYEELLTKAKFSAAPRGTNLFSYRFTEVMSAGAIPVVHADGWVWPFRRELVRWEDCAVVMRERDANATERVLRSIDAPTRCKMRRKCYDIYKRYMSSGEGVVAGLVEGLELRASAPVPYSPPSLTTTTTGSAEAAATSSASSSSQTAATSSMSTAKSNETQTQPPPAASTIGASKNETQTQTQQQQPPPFKLNDVTVSASPRVRRLWLGDGKMEVNPPAKILLTNFGWNNPNQTAGLNYVRTIRSKELLQGVIDHPWFDPSGWEDINSGKVEADPSIRYYVFLDVETCFEQNYPVYSGKGMRDNGDLFMNRTLVHKREAECYNMAHCPYVPKALDAPLFSQDNIQATLVIISCRGGGLPKSFRKRKRKGPSVAVAAVSTPLGKINPEIDQGLTPPAVKPVMLTPEQEKDIESCNEEKRPLLLFFSGAGRGEIARRAIIELNNDKDIITMKRKFIGGNEKSYEELLAGSKFSATPRGTDLFSYRFTEVLSAGSIPVVHADGWVLPFRKELVDWSECAVIMPESEANRTEEVLRAIGPEQRCKMRKKCYEIYKNYMETPEKEIAGIVDGLELVLPTLADGGDIQENQGNSTGSSAAILNDRTISLSPDVERPWLDVVGNGSNPPAKLLLTTFGWNQPNHTRGLQFARSARNRELIQGVVDHPWFDPSGWEDYLSGKKDIDPNVRYYIFLDVETCFEGNYPAYAGGQGFKVNADQEGGRVVMDKDRDKCYRIKHCPFIPKALQTPLFAKGIQSKLVIFDCKGDGPPFSFRGEAFNTSSISIASASSEEKKLIEAYDQGLPPPAVNPVKLSPDQEKDIDTCNETSRPYLLTFSGAGRGEKARIAIVDLNNNKDIFTVKRKQFKGEQELTYEDLLTKTKFSAAPRGTNLFSYRFTEVMSAGAIPVVHADGWVWPFRKELVDWNDCAVIIPEAKANETEAILRGIDADQRCRMRKRCYEIYKKYMETGAGIVSGVVEGLELSAAKN